MGGKGKWIGSGRWMVEHERGLRTGGGGVKDQIEDAKVIWDDDEGWEMNVVVGLPRKYFLTVAIAYPIIYHPIPTHPPLIKTQSLAFDLSGCGPAGCAWWKRRHRQRLSQWWRRRCVEDRGKGRYTLLTEKGWCFVGVLWNYEFVNCCNDIANWGEARFLWEECD